MKWLGQHIWDFISRFRSTVYLEDVSNTSSDVDKFLVAESDGKVGYRTGAEVLSDIGAASSASDITGVSITTDSGSGSKAEDTSGSADFSILGSSGVGVTNSGTTITAVAVPSEIDHDSLSNFVAAEHYRWDTDISSTATIHTNNITDLHGAGVSGSANQLLTDDGDGTITSQTNLTFTGSALGVTGIVNIAPGGTAGNAALFIDNHDADQIALNIDAENTTAAVINIDADALTTGKLIDCTATTSGLQVGLLDFDITNADTGTSTTDFLDIDYNKNGVTADGESFVFKGIDIDYDDSATNHSNSAALVWGINVDLNNSSAQGAITHIGTSINCSGADAANTTGLLIKTPNDAHDIRIASSASSSDIFTIDTKDDGETTLTTLETGGGSTAHFNVVADGKITMTPADISGQALIIDADADTDNEVEINAGLLDINATAAITIDAATSIDIESGKSQINKTYDFHASAFENLYNADQASGTIIKYSPGSSSSLNGSEIYYLRTNGTWVQAIANAADTSDKLLGVGLGGDPQTVGVLLKGFVRIASTEILNTPGSGAVDGLPIYLSDTTAGHFDFTAPSSSGDIVRVVGYAIDDDSGDVLIYFDPDKTWIEIA